MLVNDDLGKSVVETGIYLGCSHYEKDCCWRCFLYNGKYYISLNSDYDSVHEVSNLDINVYCEHPTNEYLQLLEEKKSTDAADKFSSNKYNF